MFIHSDIMKMDTLHNLVVTFPQHAPGGIVANHDTGREGSLEPLYHRGKLVEIGLYQYCEKRRHIDGLSYIYFNGKLFKREYILPKMYKFVELKDE